MQFLTSFRFYYLSFTALIIFLFYNFSIWIFFPFFNIFKTFIIFKFMNTRFKNYRINDILLVLKMICILWTFPFPIIILKIMNFYPFFPNDKFIFPTLLPLSPLSNMTIFLLLCPSIPSIILFSNIFLPIFFPYLSILISTFLEPYIILLDLLFWINWIRKFRITIWFWHFSYISINGFFDILII